MKAIWRSDLMAAQVLANNHFQTYLEKQLALLTQNKVIQTTDTPTLPVPGRGDRVLPAGKREDVRIEQWRFQCFLTDQGREGYYTPP